MKAALWFAAGVTWVLGVEALAYRRVVGRLLQGRRRRVVVYRPGAIATPVSPDSALVRQLTAEVRRRGGRW